MRVYCVKCQSGFADVDENKVDIPDGLSLDDLHGLCDDCAVSSNVTLEEQIAGRIKAIAAGQALLAESLSSLKKQIEDNDDDEDDNNDDIYDSIDLVVEIGKHIAKLKDIFSVEG